MLSRNFTRAEFKCKCGSCDYDTVDAELIRALQSLRDYVGAPITITSGNRYPEYNLSVGGSYGSFTHIDTRTKEARWNG